MKLAARRSQGLVRALVNRLLHFYFLLTRGLTLGVRAIVRADDGKFLLVRHTYTPGWYFPGGGVEKGESVLHTLQRELREETCLTLVGTQTLYGVFHNGHVSGRDHVLVYLCEATGNLPSHPPSREIAEIGFFDLKNLPKDMDPGTLRRITEIDKGTQPSTAW